MPKEGTVCLLQFLEAQPNQEFVMSHLDEQHGILSPSAWIWASHNDCVLFVSWRYEICINNVSLMRHRKHRPHKSRLPAVDIRQIEISWHAVWELWLVGKGMRKLLTKSQERRRTARHLHEWYQLFKQSTRYKYYAFISLERHTSLFGFFLNTGVWRRKGYFPLEAFAMVCDCICVCVHAACLCVELWDKQFAPFTKCPAFMETAAYSKFHSWGFFKAWQAQPHCNSAN